jgi:protoheme IX farnesyltransferase
LIREYYNLIKPGIIYGNSITVIAGFLLASRGQPFDISLFLGVVTGISSVMAGGCVFNNCFDRDIDARMQRTKNRALVKKTISLKGACIYGSVLSLLGFLLLYFSTNMLTVTIAAFGFFMYTSIYTMYFKRSSLHSTLIGAFSGAVPPVIGYVAVTEHIDIVAVVLFLILVTWQMGHAFAIALYRLDDYTKADIYVLPVKKGVYSTKLQMVVYLSLFGITVFALPFFTSLGIVYMCVVGALSSMWLIYAVQGFFIKNSDEQVWAKNMFRLSLIVLLGFCVTIGGGW